MDFSIQMALLGCTEPVPEYRFDPARRWRIDWAWPEHRIAVEIEGGVYTRGRHTRPKGFLADLAKYNALARAGWRLFRFTPRQVSDGGAAAYMARVFEESRR